MNEIYLLNFFKIKNHFLFYIVINKKYIILLIIDLKSKLNLICNII